MANKMADLIVTTSDLSKVLGLSDRRIRQLHQEGIISQVTRGNFRLPEAVQAYIKFLQTGGNPTTSQLNFKDEKALLTRAQRIREEIELDLLRKEIHRGEDIKMLLVPILSAFRARCLAIPQKAAPLVAGKSEITDIQIIIKKEVSEALKELSEIDPASFISDTEHKAREPDGRKDTK
jgi:hypothetical protein